MNTLTRAWERFWFRPQATSTIALLRIAVGALSVLWTLQMASDFDHFFGPDALVIGPGYTPILAGVLLLSTLALTVGFRSQLAAAVTLVCMSLLFRADPLIFNTGDALLRHLLLFLALGPSGASLSVDSARRESGGQWRFPMRAPWALRLAQLQVALMYVVSFTQKLKGSTWRDGTAVSYVLRVVPDQRFALPNSISASTTWAHVFTWGTLGVEAAIALLVWNRLTRPWVLALGAALHLSIDLALRTGLFSWIVLASYVAFIPPETATRLVARFRRSSDELDVGARRQVTPGVEDIAR